MPDTENVSDRTYKRLTTEELRVIDAALDACSGNRAHAAKTLEMDEGRLRNAVVCTPWLRAKWTTEVERGIPGSSSRAGELHRGKPTLPPDKLAEAVATIKEDKELVQTEWGALGYKPQEIEFMHALQNQYASNLKGTMDLAYGGSAHATTRLLMKLETINEHLEDIEKNPDKYRRFSVTNTGHEYEVKGPHEFMMETYDRFIAIADALRKMNATLTEANKTRLVMAKMVKDQASADNGPKKVAGWQPDSRGVVDAKTQEIL